MPDHARRRTEPMQPSSYRAAARTVRKMADQLDARAEAQTPQERRARTSAVHRLARYARHLLERHQRREES